MLYQLVQICSDVYMIEKNTVPTDTNFVQMSSNIAREI